MEESVRAIGVHEAAVLGAGSQPPWQERLAPPLVWATWLFMTAAALLYIHHYGRNLPTWDDWSMVPAWTGSQPLTLSWLWSQHNEHRIPLTRLIMLGLLKVSGGDLRSGMILNALLLSALALAFMITVGRLRGRPHLADALFPVLILHPGHHNTILWFFTVTNVVLVALFAYLLLSIAKHPRAHETLPLAPFGACLLALPLCGGGGVVAAFLLALWLLGVAVVQLQSPGAKRFQRGLFALSLSLSAFFLTCLYFYGWMPAHAQTKRVVEEVVVAARFLAGSLGNSTVQYWPEAGFLATALAVSVVYTLTKVFVKERSERQRTAGLALCFMTVLVQACAVGRLRGNDAGFESRHLVFSMFFILCLVVTWVLYHPQRRTVLLQTALLIFVCTTAVRDYTLAKFHGRGLRNAWNCFSADAQAGMPSLLLAAKCPLTPRHQQLVEGLELLRHSGYCGMGEPVAQELAEVPADLQFVSAHDMDWSGMAGTAGTGDPYVVFRSKMPRHVKAVQLEIVLPETSENPTPFQFFWQRWGATSFSEDRSFWKSLVPMSEPQAVLVYIDEEIDHFRIDPGIKGCRFELRSAKFVVVQPDHRAHVAGGQGPAAGPRFR